MRSVDFVQGLRAKRSHRPFGEQLRFDSHRFEIVNPAALNAPTKGQCGSRRLAPRWIGDRLANAACVPGASSRGEQPPLPALAGFEFEFVAEDVASQDGSLSTLRWSIVSPRKMRGRRVRPSRGSLVIKQRLGPVVVARDRNLVASFCPCAQRKTAGVSDNLTLRGRRNPWRNACPFI
jgi:hypothetical protein